MGESDPPACGGVNLRAPYSQGEPVGIKPRFPFYPNLATSTTTERECAPPPMTTPLTGATSL